MVITLIVIGFLYAITGIPNSVMDKISFHYLASIFSKRISWFWNPNLSWTRKWKDGRKGKGERFLFSSTIFVFLTDGWHFSKWTMFTLIEAIIMILLCILYGWSFYWILVGIIILKCLRGGTFTLFFDFILVKSKNNLG